MQPGRTEKAPPAMDRILLLFPNRMETIKKLYQKSHTFREICADYREMVTWLEDYCRSDKRDWRNCDYGMEVLKGLEAELIDSLEGRHASVAKERHNGQE